MIRSLFLLPLISIIALLLGCGGGSAIPTTPGLDTFGASGGGGSTNPSNSSDDDGTPDQGKGDWPGSGESSNDDSPSGDDDGTPDQGKGDRRSASAGITSRLFDF